MANREEIFCDNIIEHFNKGLSNCVKSYKEETKKANRNLTNKIICIVNEIALLSHCAGMLYEKENYEVYINTVEELKKMLYEKLEEL